MNDNLVRGVTARRVPTDRLVVDILHDDRSAGEPVVLVHGNVSSALFFQPTLLALPDGFRGIAVDLRGFR